ncbi:helix-turn-helix transcriptional regulator [Nitratiruptor sp. YY09-18]|uniref:ArsR/SmtB family transcription factor n=1 Tax=Nitratiruptor sp. YY09-18 TaxID=2724901 RepID=UPI0019158D94|nr:metalloregulator ArsR/SmtB family transcription factor [Nitratiruptor sp. YY09-18]BCD68164.1 ArsR family transcriptional regulator, arsenate/arsenite/antimonite-responsive transcriptional repressor [Nitratiruptor sp. YY09-18]
MDRLEKLAAVAKALSDINRLKVLAFIDRYKEVCVCEVSDTLGFSQPLTSKYLKQLKDVGIVKSRKSGKWSIFSIADNHLIQPFLKELKNIELPNIKKCARC